MKFNRKWGIGLTAFVVAALLFTALGNYDLTGAQGSSDEIATLTVTPTVTNAPTNVSPTDAPTATMTATALPTQELQVPWTPVNFTPVVTEEIPWDHLLLVGNWIESPGLAPDVTVFYVQSGTPNMLTLPGLPFVVPDGQHLIFGGFKAVLSILNSDGTISTYMYSNGFYAALPAGTTVVDLTITNGFALLAVDTNGDSRNEFCYRVAQAYAEGWAHKHVYHSPAWSGIVCEGIYSVPLDNDR